MRNFKLVLASASPRRRELLEMIGFRDFEIVPALYEDKLDLSLHPGNAAEKVAYLKAKSVAERVGSNCIVLGADTVVFADGVLLQKPESDQDAYNMLQLLSGKTHCVYTGIALLGNGMKFREYAETLVTFRSLNDSEIWDYIKTGEPTDKAGAYGAQGRGAVFIERIEGDFFNVVGLPLCIFGRMIDEIGYSRNTG